MSPGQNFRHCISQCILDHEPWLPKFPSFSFSNFCCTGNLFTPLPPPLSNFCHRCCCLHCAIHRICRHCCHCSTVVPSIAIVVTLPSRLPPLLPPHYILPQLPSCRPWPLSLLLSYCHFCRHFATAPFAAVAVALPLLCPSPSPVHHAHRRCRCIAIAHSICHNPPHLCHYV